MNKIPLAILLIILVRAFFIIQADKAEAPIKTEMMEEQQATESAVMDTEKMDYTLDAVAEHNTPEDCWFIIDGAVYDVSGFDAKHPGEEAVYEGCGLDATELFETRPMGSGTPHSKDARGFLPNFEIGKLATQ